MVRYLSATGAGQKGDADGIKSGEKKQSNLLCKKKNFGHNKKLVYYNTWRERKEHDGGGVRTVG